MARSSARRQAGANAVSPSATGCSRRAISPNSPTIGDDAAATIYLYISSTLAAQAAAVVGDIAQANRLKARAETVRRRSSASS